ncbi:MAG: hypothetical protein MUC63_09220, partial [Planctomycetes bacterium]|nr:hypothetical protein [Planctomycetota bacterium]
MRRRRGIRVAGLVRAARELQEELAAGVPAGDRESFLSRARARVEEGEAALRGLGATPSRLPAPSRNALAALRRIAAATPETIPEPAPGAAPPRRIRVEGVERALRAALRGLGGPGGAGGSLGRVREGIQSSADKVRRACARRGADPGGLPPRARRAFGMLSWLSAPGNLDRYADRVAEALPPIASVSRARWPDSARTANVAFEPGRHLYKVRHDAGAHLWTLSLGFLAAGPGDFEDLAAVIRRRGRASREAAARHRAFVRSPAFRDVEREILGPLEDARGGPRGRAWDLEDLFLRVNGRCFGGALPRPRLVWSPSVARRTFGTYEAAADRVCLNPLLDDPDVPRFVAEFILFHELLHKKLGAAAGGRRRAWHTAAFRREERAHPDYAEAKRWLDAL